MRLLPLLAVTFGCLFAAQRVHADTPLPPPAKHVARSPSRAIEVESDPGPGLTTTYRVGADGTRTRLWAMNGWYRAIYPADDGEHLVLGFEGLNLLPANVADDLIVVRFVRRGEVVAALTLHDVVPDRSILRRTASHLAWREGEGIDADGHFLVVTLDGVKHHFDVTTGRPLDSRPPPGAAASVGPLGDWVAGTFSNAAQARTDPDCPDALLRVVRIWGDRADAVWLYVEQAHASSPSSPVRQRIHSLRALVGGTVEMRVYDLDDPAKVAGAWRDPSRLSGVAPEGLVERRGCTVLLRAVDANTYAGSTAGRQCTDAAAGAGYATSELTVTPKGLVVWDRGFDASGRQTSGPTQGGYRFDRIAPR